MLNRIFQNINKYLNLIFSGRKAYDNAFEKKQIKGEKATFALLADYS